MKNIYYLIYLNDGRLFETSTIKESTRRINRFYGLNLTEHQLVSWTRKKPQNKPAKYNMFTIEKKKRC